MFSQFFQISQLIFIPNVCVFTILSCCTPRSCMRSSHANTKIHLMPIEAQDALFHCKRPGRPLICETGSWNKTIAFSHLCCLPWNLSMTLLRLRFLVAQHQRFVALTCIDRSRDPMTLCLSHAPAEEAHCQTDLARSKL